MFTLIGNYKKLFSLCIANGLEGPVADFDANGDNDISGPELQALLEQSPEAREAATLAEVETLEAAAELAPNELINRDSDPIKQKTVQYLATKILRLTGRGSDVRDGSIDGRIGSGSLADIKLASGMDFTGTDVDINVINELVAKAGEVVTKKRAEIAETARLREAAENDARALLAAYNTIDEVRALTRDEIRAVQEALNTLGHNVGTADGVAGNNTENGFNAYVSARNEAGEQANIEAAQAEIAARDADVRTATTGLTGAEVRVARNLGEVNRIEGELEAARARAEETQAALDAANAELARAEGADEAADERERVRDAALRFATNQAELARLALEAANEELLTLTGLDEAADERERVRDAALTFATNQAEQARLDLEAANGELLRLTGLDEAADAEVIRLQGLAGQAQSNFDSLGFSGNTDTILAVDEAQTAVDLAGRRQTFFETIFGELASQSYADNGIDPAEAVFIHDGELWIDVASRARNHQVTTPVDLASLGFDSLEDLKDFIIGKVDAQGNVQDLSVEADEALTLATRYAELQSANTELAEGIRLAGVAQTELDDAQTHQGLTDREYTDRQETLRLATEAALEAGRQAEAARLALEDARLSHESVDSDNTDAQAALARAQTELQEAQRLAALAETELGAASAEIGVVGMQDRIADGRVTDIEGELRDAGFDLEDMEDGRDMAAARLRHAEVAAEAAREAELDAYINDLTNSGANETLVTLIEENDGAREMIDRLRNMPPNRIQALGNALAYFGVSTDFAGLEAATGDMVVAVIEFALSENMDISEMTAEYVIQLNEAYQEKADELGEIIAGLNTRGYLDTGRTAAENYFNVTTGYPDFEYVTQEGVFSISNGLRGRPRAHTHTTYTTTDTYLTENRHRVTQDGDGETIGSSHTSERNQIGSVTVGSSETRRWFEMYPGGMEREQISALISSGEATLRPSYQMLSRLYEPRISGNGVELVEQSWYAEMTEWSRELEQREGGEMSIVNEEVSIQSKMMGSVINEVQREAPDRYAEIQTEVREDILSSQEFSFLIWDAERGERASALQLVGRQVQHPGGATGWTLGVFDPATGEVVGDIQNFASGDEMLASSLGQQAMMMSTYRYFGVVTSTTEGGLRFVDDQGLIRCGDHERVVLLDEPAPVLPQGYNFLRNGLPCGVLGAYCTSSGSHTTNIRELETDEWTYNEQTREDTDESSDEDSDESTPEGTEESTTTDPGVEGGTDVGGGGEGGVQGGNGRG